MARESFVLYSDAGTQIGLLSDEEAGALFKALFRYVGEDVSPKDLSPAANMAFAFMKAQINRDGEKYENVKQKRAEAGRKGGLHRAANQANASFAKQSQANQADNVPVPDPVPVPDNVPVSVNSRESVADKPPTLYRFIKPSLSEISSFCQANNLNVDPERFFDVYESNGWMVGKTPMVDWRAKVRDWARKEITNGRAERLTGGVEKAWNDSIGNVI